MNPIRRYARAVPAVAMACVLAILASAAQAGLFPTYPTGTGAGVWEVDRYAPAGFANAGTVNGRPSVLALELSANDSQANRPPQFSTAFYNTQGRGMQHETGAYSVLYGSLYIPGAWATTNPGNALLNHRTDMWGVLSPATGGDVCAQSACNLFPYIGFTNASPTDALNAGGTGRMRVWDGNVGNVDLPTPVGYDRWTDVCIAFTGTELRFYLDGAQVYVQTNLAQGDDSYGPPTKWTRTIVQAYNFGTGYTANWSGLGAGKLDTTAVDSGNNQVTAPNTAFPVALGVIARDSGGAPLPCIPITFSAPVAGASASLSAVTVMTDRNGLATVNATANGTPGSYTVQAAAPGLTDVAINLTNQALPAAIVATGGGGQSTPVTTAFAQPLAARVTNAQAGPVAGATVTFTLPASGASGTFPGNVTTVNIVTDGTGTATSPVVTANATVGSYNATATVTGAAQPATFALTNTIVAATLSKSFAPSTIAPASTSVLTIALGNPNPVPLVLAQAFTDVMPAGVSVQGAVGGTCAGATASTGIVALPAGSSVPPGGCTIVVTVWSVTPGNAVNTTSTLVTQAGTAAAASATLVVATPGGVSAAKRFAPAAIKVGESSTLTITLGNTAAAPAVLRDAFTDVLPTGLVFEGGATGTCTGVTVAPAQLSMAAGNAIPVGGCTIVAVVRASSVGTFNNVTSSLATGAGNAPPASATLAVADGSPGVPLQKSFAPSTIAAGGTSTLTISFGNSSGVPAVLTAAFTDAMPAGVTMVGGNAGTCQGVTTTATAIGWAAGGVVPANGCTVVVTVTSSTVGTVTNVTSPVVTDRGSAPPASASITVAPIALTASGGGGQATPIGTSFAQPLVASVTSGGVPVAGIPVTFALPASLAAAQAVAAAGASATFAGGATTVVVPTNAQGVATSPVVVANGIEGSYTATATVAGLPPVTYALVNLPDSPVASQPIPATGPLGLLLLVLALAGCGMRAMRRR